MKIHELKVWPEFFQLMLDDTKTFEIRENDRGFRVNDLLHLREWDPKENLQVSFGGRMMFVSKGYTGRELVVRVTYMMDLGSPFNITPGYVVMECLTIYNPDERCDA